jgi:hypothetical protein
MLACLIPLGGVNGRSKVIQKISEMLKLKGASILVVWDGEVGGSYGSGDGLFLCFFFVFGFQISY